MEATVRLDKGLESKLERLPRDERAPRIELISGLARFVVSVDSSEKLAKLGEVLESLPKVGEGASKEAALEAARMRNLVRVLRDRARLKEESFRSGEVEDLFVVGCERLSRCARGARSWAWSGGSGALPSTRAGSSGWTGKSWRGCRR